MSRHFEVVHACTSVKLYVLQNFNENHNQNPKGLSLCFIKCVRVKAKTYPQKWYVSQIAERSDDENDE